MRRSLTAHSATLPAKQQKKNNPKTPHILHCQTHLAHRLPFDANTNKNDGTHVAHMCRDNRRKGKPLRQVHLKVLRNWQVNCAMHAWATALWGALHAGPGRYSSLLLGTCTPILSPLFFFCWMSTWLQHTIPHDVTNTRKAESLPLMSPSTPLHTHI